MKRDQLERLNICDKKAERIQFFFLFYSSGIPVSGREKQADWLHTDFGDMES